MSVAVDAKQYLELSSTVAACSPSRRCRRGIFGYDAEL